MLGLLGFGGLVVVWIFVKVWKNRQGGDEPDAAASFGGSPLGNKGGFGNQVKFKLGLDGFWLEGGAVTLGSWISYRYLCEGKWHVGRVRYQPGATGQFVYTGARPESVEILAVQAEGAESIDFDSSSISDTTNFDTPTAAWYATRDSSSDATTAGQDPPAY